MGNVQGIPSPIKEYKASICLIATMDNLIIPDKAKNNFEMLKYDSLFNLMDRATINCQTSQYH